MNITATNVRGRSRVRFWDSRWVVRRTVADYNPSLFGAVRGAYGT